MKKSGFHRQNRWRGKSILITLILVCVSYYFVLPPLNLHSTELIRFLIGCLLVYILIALLCAAKEMQRSDEEEDADQAPPSARLGGYVSFAKKHCKPVLAVVLVAIAIFLVGQVVSLPLFRASAYHNLLPVETGDFSTDVEQLPYSEIPMLDESSAQRLGDRKLGELSDMVSQFKIAEEYTQINVQNRPVRVACLEYGDIFKWLINCREGLPAYVKVDGLPGGRNRPDRVSGPARHTVLPLGIPGARLEPDPSLPLPHLSLQSAPPGGRRGRDPLVGLPQRDPNHRPIWRNRYPGRCLAQRQHGRKSLLHHGGDPLLGGSGLPGQPDHRAV